LSANAGSSTFYFAFVVTGNAYNMDDWYIDDVSLTAQITVSVSSVDLWYRHSPDNASWGAWSLYGADTLEPYEWPFSWPDGLGHYEFYSVAHDTLGRHEAPPQFADARHVHTGVTLVIPLSLGWNLVSVPFAQANASLEAVFASIAGKWDRAMWYDPADPEDHWKQHCTDWDPTLNDLLAIDCTMGLWLRATENATLTLCGTPADSTSVLLRAGWNLVGYPTMTESIVAMAFWGTGADIVESFDPGAEYLTAAMGPAQLMQPGKAYWVHVNFDAVWTVDW
jgi:hypothetical protein